MHLLGQTVFKIRTDILTYDKKCNGQKTMGITVLANMITFTTYCTFSTAH